MLRFRTHPRGRNAHWRITASLVVALPLTAFFGCDRKPSPNLPKAQARTALTANTPSGNDARQNAARVRASCWLANKGMREGVLHEGGIAAIGTAHAPPDAGANRQAVQTAIEVARLAAVSDVAMALGYEESTEPGSDGTPIVRKTGVVAVEGIETVRVDEAAAPGGGTDVAVIVLFTPRGSPHKQPDGGTNAEAWVQALTIDQLLKLNGARQMQSASGAPFIVGFGQATASGDRRAVDFAITKAEVEAMGAARRFAGEQLSATERVDLTTRADGKKCTERTVESASPSMAMPDMVALRNWQHSSGAGQTIVGVVVMVPQSGIQPLSTGGDSLDSSATSTPNR